MDLERFADNQASSTVDRHDRTPTKLGTGSCSLEDPDDTQSLIPNARARRQLNGSYRASEPRFFASRFKAYFKRLLPHPKFYVLLVAAGLLTYRAMTLSQIQEFAAVPSVGQSRRAYVCITGQLERLELMNKVATVLEPLRRSGLEPDIAFVISDSTGFTTNTQRVDEPFLPAYESISDASEYLGKFGFNVVTTDHYVQVENPLVPEPYLLALKQTSSSKFTDEQHLARAENNIRMLESWSECYSEMARQIDGDGYNAYEVVVRIREDTGFLSALNFDEIRKDIEENPSGLISNACRAIYNHTAMNDKFAIMSAHVARTYFQAPFHNLYAKPITELMKNTERYTFETYVGEDLSVVYYESIRKVVKLVNDSEGKVRLFNQEKKKLAKMCSVDILDDTVPQSCEPVWNEESNALEILDDVCWPFVPMDGNH